MKRFLPICSLILFSHISYSQVYEKLEALKGSEVTTYFSKGHNQRAKQIATRVENVINYYNDLLKFKPTVSILILSKEDWSSYTRFPVYGMPHYNYTNAVLIVAAEDNEFWRSFLSLKDLPEEVQKEAKKVYNQPGVRLNDAVGQDSFSMRAFFDLLAIHELGHAFHNQGKLEVQRKWMGELFCNILLHTYIAEKEPDQLPVLTLLPKIAVSGGTKNYKFTSLQELEEKYTEIAQQYPQNYGWYQFRWHSAAAVIYEEQGKSAFLRLWTTLQNEKTKLNDASLAELLQNKVGKSVADVMLRWDTETIR